MYQKTVLDNGLKVITEVLPQFRSATIGVWINAGSGNETPEFNGITHFIEHLMFKGTKRHTATKIAEIMDSLGGLLNAFTEKEQTCYYAKVMDKHLPVAIEILSDMVLNSLFDKVEINRERGVILDEIRIYEDSPDDYIFDLFHQTLWKGHPLGQITLGKPDVVSKLKREDFIDYVNKNYTPNNTTITIAGNINHKKVVDQIKKYFDKSKKQVCLQKKQKKIKTFHDQTIKYRQGEQIYLCMGGEGASQLDEDKYKLIVLDSILGGSASSRLFQEIREKRGLVYTIGTFQYAFKIAGSFGICASMSKDNLSRVLKLIFKILSDLKKNGITSKELKRTKEHLKGGIALTMESTANRMIRLAKSEFYHGKLLSFEKMIEKIERVTSDDVNYMIQKFLNKDKFTCAVSGPIRNFKISKFF